MTEESTAEFRNKLKDDSEKLFVLLNKEKLSEEDKQQAEAIIAENPQILSWKDFTAKVALPDLMSEYNEKTNVAELINRSEQSLQNTKRVLDNLQQMKKEGFLTAVDKPATEVIDTGLAPNGETIATQTFKNINFLDTLKGSSNVSEPEKESIANHLSKNYKIFLDQMYKGENNYGADPNQQNLQGQEPKGILKNIMTDKNNERNSLMVEGKKEQDMPQKTLTIEDLKNKAYQGTLTVEQADQLRKLNDDKKIADMKSLPGDEKRHKREPRQDKFRDEDVIKYMYEDWFLGGASWLFNKAEAYILDTIDWACDKSVERARNRRQKINEMKNEKAKIRINRANDFIQTAGDMMNGLGAECTAKAQSYESILQDIQKNIGNQHPQWEYFSADDSFIKKLETDLMQARQFVQKTSQELKNRTEVIEMTGKLAMLITSTQMTDEFMKNPNEWNKNDQPASDDQLKEMFVQRYQDTQKNILTALSVMAEDNRLMSEAIYNTLAEPQPALDAFTQKKIDQYTKFFTEEQPDLDAFTQKYLTNEQNDFLEQLSEQAKRAAELQQKELEAGHLDHHVSSEVAATINKVNKQINNKIQNGNIYNEKMFEDEHSKERINAKVGLYEEAMKKNSRQSLQNLFNYTIKLNQYQQETLNSRLTKAKERKEKVKQYKIKITNRDQSLISRLSRRGVNSANR